ncbi:MAG: TetR/AcrR family transcriptional regulator [Beijerinckiaceae bacterium]
MSNTSPRPRKRDGAATREKILAEALRLFAHRGYDATSIRDISTAVGVADAALYRHFPSKEEIASAVFVRHYSALAGRISQIATRPQPTAAIVNDLIALLCDLFDAEQDVFTFLLIHQYDHLRYVELSGNPVEEITAIMRAGIERGDIRVASAELAAAVALGAAIQPAVFTLYGRLKGPLTEKQEEIANAVSRALGLV